MVAKSPLNDRKNNKDPRSQAKASSMQKSKSPKDREEAYLPRKNVNRVSFVDDCEEPVGRKSQKSAQFQTVQDDSDEFYEEFPTNDFRSCDDEVSDTEPYLTTYRN